MASEMRRWRSYDPTSPLTTASVFKIRLFDSDSEDFQRVDSRIDYQLYLNRCIAEYFNIKD